MECYSTNRKSATVTFKEAVLKGMADDNGLYMPVHIPKLSPGFFRYLHKLSLREIAFEVAAAYLQDELAENVIAGIVDKSLNFDIPLVQITDDLCVLELFHGPTLAFKDVGARFMAKLLSHYLKQADAEATVLVATSGDTGSAVANAYLNVPEVNVVLLYPSGKVSEIQEKQLTTLGKNVQALEVKGTFDDCQKMVKKAFLDKAVTKKVNLTSANSINLARLIPQSFYYFYAHAQLKHIDKDVVISVPSGNFGNLTAGLIAKRMGLSVSKFLAATNVNDVVPKYLDTGKFRAKPSKRTISNAMDVGNPSNFARILDLYNGKYGKIKKDLVGYSFNDDETRKMITNVQQDYNYVLDPHGAVAYSAVKHYRKRRNVISIFLETAHPAKFIDVVEEQINGTVKIPARLKNVLDKKKQSTVIDNKFESLKKFLLS